MSRCRAFACSPSADVLHQMMISPPSLLELLNAVAAGWAARPAVAFAAVAALTVAAPGTLVGQNAIPIAEAVADFDADGAPDLRDQVVTLEGRLAGTPILIAKSATLSLISSEAAVLLVALDSTTFRGFSPGDRVRATGTLRQFVGQEQVYVSSIERLSEGTSKPRPVHVDLADVAAERWSAQLVHVTGELELDRRSGFLRATVNEGGAGLPVMIPVSLLSNPEDVERLVASAGKRVGITGTLLQNTASDSGPGYYLLPLTAADLELPPVRRSGEIGAAIAFVLVLTAAIYLWYQRQRWKRNAAALAELAGRLSDSEAALRQSEREYRSLFEEVPIGIYRVGPDGQILAWNQALLKILGVTERDLHKYRITDIYQDEEEYQRFQNGIAEREEIVGFESVWRRPNGATTIVRQNVRRVLGHDGGLSYYEGTVEDITERRYAEERLHEAEGRMRQLLLANPSIIYAVSVTETSAQVDWVSENVQRILGYSVDEALEPHWWLHAVHPEDRDWTVQQFAEFARTSTSPRPFTLEYRFRGKDGAYRWYRSDMRIIGRYGDRTEIVAAALDVSAQKEASLALAEAEAHYRRLVTTSPYGIIALDSRGRITESNPAAQEILALDSQDMVGRTAARLVPPECRPAIAAAIEKQMAGDTLQADFETWVMQPDGSRKLIHIRSAPIIASNGSRGFHAVIRDLTAERARDAHFRLLGSALDNLGHGVAISDSDRRVIYANGEFKRILGFPEDGNQEMLLDSFLPDAAAKEQLEEIQTALRTSGGWSGRKWRQRATDDRIVPIDAVAGLVPAPDGGKPHVLTIFTDASEKVEQEQQLRRAERLSSLGTLVGGVAHELNNPLNAIINFAALLLDEMEEGSVRDDLETIVREGQRAAKIVSGLRMISREADVKTPVKEPVDINDIVDHVLKLRSYSLTTSSIDISAQLDRLIPLAWGDRSRIEQVLFNLVVNAEQAMSAHRGRGNLVVRTRAVGSRVVLEVSDDGPGISSEHMPHIFDPFWTTKAPGEGTGLGLSLVHNIVTEHGGKIYVRSTPGGGTTFQVDLQVAKTSALPVKQIEPLNDSFAGKLRILVVEDELAVRRSLTRYLAREGHEVVEAVDGRQALEALASSEPFDIILSDLKMPGMGGRELFNHLRAQGNGEERKMILMTGGVGGNELSRIDETMPILLKPITFTEVAAAIKRYVEVRESALIGSSGD